MNKIWVIAFKDIRTRFTDRTLLLIMIAAPLLISTIIGLAFGGLGGSSSPVSYIPVIVINNDQPGDSSYAYGAILTSLLTTGAPPASSDSTQPVCPKINSQASSNSGEDTLSLGELIKGSVFDQAAAEKLVADKSIETPTAPAGSPDYLAAAAKSAIDKGLYSAVVIIPQDYSSALASLTDPRQASASAKLVVYGNAGQTLYATIIRSVVDGITSRFITGSIAIGDTLSEVFQQNPSTPPEISTKDVNALFICATDPGNDLITLVNQPVQAAPVSTAGTLLVTFGSAQAIFFALFVGQNGILSMYDERRNGTLQRILASPTPKWAVLTGKLIGVFVSVLVQLIFLAIALTLVGSLLEKRFTFIWGSNVVMLGLLLLAVSVAVSGLGMLLAGIIKGIEQANVVSSVLNIALGVLGGAFGFQLARNIAQFSLVYWARNAFDLLASGRGDITLNLQVLFIEGAVMFGIGLLLFNRNFEV